MSAKQKSVVGLFVVGGFLLFALGLFWIGDRRLLFSDSIELETRFTQLSGLKVGSKVMVRGMDAGEVLAIHVPSSPAEKFRLSFRVLSHFQPVLRTDSIASIQVEGLVGSKVLQVEAGSGSAPPISAGAVLPSREPIEISAIVSQVVDVVGKINVAVDDVHQRVDKAVDTITNVGESAQVLVTSFGRDANEILGSSKKVARNIDSIVENVQQGHGFAGKLLKDDKLYARFESASQDVQKTAANVSTMSDDVRKVVADIRSRKLGEKFEATATNVQQATAHLKNVLAELKPDEGPDQRGLLEDVRDSLNNTREATSDLAENMEALKRNWFFRGYFKRRGFFDLDAISLDDYREGKIAPDRGRERTWHHAPDLFTTSQNGRETLSDRGVKQLTEAMAPFLRFAPNTLLVVEGYSGQGSESGQFLHSRERARLVRQFLIDRFGLKPNFVGAIPMGAVASSAPSGQPFEGVSLVFFPEKKK